MTNKITTGIIGGGITGLATAWYLKNKGIEATVYEKNDSPGGVIRSRNTGGWLVEEGPNTLLARTERTWGLLNDLGLESRLLRAGNEAKHRFIIKNGRPMALPAGLPGFFKTRLISTGAKLRMLAEPFISPKRKPEEEVEESIADFVRRRFGEEALEYGVDPFIAGIYAGSPEKLSVKHTFPSLYHHEQQYGSVLKGFFKNKGAHSPEKVLVSFNKGLQTLPDTLFEKLGASVKTGAEVTGIRREGNGWKLLFSDGSGSEHNALVSTLPSDILAGLLPGETDPEIRSALKELPYAPVSILALGFRREQVSHPLDGFGMLVPSAEPFDILGTLFSSSLYPDRAPEGHVLLTAFVGGTRNPEQAAKTEGQLLSEVIPELSLLLGIEGSPVFTHHTYWERAIPQYSLRYGNCLDSMKYIESNFPGFFVRGNIRGGVSVPDCISSAFETAEQIEMFLSTENGISTFGT